MDFEWTDALPIGILMFAGSLIAATRRKAGRALAQRNYPSVAKRLGLTFEPPKHPAGVGQLTGQFQGREILVQPDERPRIVVYLKGEPSIELRSYPHWKRAPEGYAAFSLGSQKLNRWLPNRYCALGAEERFSESEPLATALAELQLFGAHIKQVVVEPGRLECVFDYGTPPYIPASDVAQLVPTCVRVVAEVEACLRG
jgi:hypothetical protein